MPTTLRLLIRPVTRGLTAVALAGSALGAQTISFADFSSTAGLQLNGSAAQSGNLLQLTPATFNQGGSAFSTTPEPATSALVASGVAMLGAVAHRRRRMA